jgi:ATP-binding cassette subfamily B protein
MMVSDAVPQAEMQLSTALLSLLAHVSRRRRWQLLVLVVLAFMTSIAELATIGAVIPFIAALISPQRILDSPAAAPVLTALSIRDASQLLLPISVLFGVLGLLAAAIRLLQLYASIRFSFGLGTELGTSMYRRSLYQPYEVHARRGSSELIAAISVKSTQIVNYVVLAVILLVGSAITAVSVIGGLIIVDPLATLGTFAGLAVIYAFILRYSRLRIYRSGVEISNQATLTIKLLQEGLGGVRDVLIGHSQEAYSEAYRRADERLRRAQGYNQWLALGPRFGIEGLAMCAVALLAYWLSLRPGGVTTALPILAAIALGAQRLLPVMQQIYNSIINIRANHAPLVDCLRLLDQPVPEKARTYVKLPFRHEIVLRDIRFAYDLESGNVLDGVTLTVRRGQRVGIIGETGSGKSTLIDIVMGLLVPSGGQMSIDGVLIDGVNRQSWQLNLSHVPQSIFLIDASVAENIALTTAGDPIDFDRVRKCAAMANIADTIERMPSGYQSRVGERGVMLSGGQRQRIGIARALYKQADVIVLDEATSALDGATEQEVMNSINELGHDLTFIIVAHRLSTLANCDLVVELEGGHIARAGPYLEIVATDAH